MELYDWLKYGVSSIAGNQTIVTMKGQKQSNRLNISCIIFTVYGGKIYDPETFK